MITTYLVKVVLCLWSKILQSNNKKSEYIKGVFIYFSPYTDVYFVGFLTVHRCVFYRLFHCIQMCIL